MSMLEKVELTKDAAEAVATRGGDGATALYESLRIIRYLSEPFTGKIGWLVGVETDLPEMRLKSKEGNEPKFCFA